MQWNAAASHRIETYGADRVVTGDLVLVQDDAARAAARNRGAARQQQQQQQSPQQAGSAGDEGAAALDATAAADDDEAGAAEEAAGGTNEVHVVTAEEAAAGRFSIDDVVLPLPGYESVYPQHATAEVYSQLAAADGVSLEAAPHGCQEFSIAALRGGYRCLLHRPTDLEVGAGSGGLLWAVAGCFGRGAQCTCHVPCRAGRPLRLWQHASLLPAAFSALPSYRLSCIPLPCHRCRCSLS